MSGGHLGRSGRADRSAALALPAAISWPGPAILASAGTIWLRSVGAARSTAGSGVIRHASTSLGVSANHFSRPKNYDVSQNSCDSPERCVDLTTGPADLLGADRALAIPPAHRKGAIYECAFAHYRRRGSQCSKGADGANPHECGDFAFRHPRLPVPHSPVLSTPRAMRMPSVRAKANLHLQPILRPWTKRRAGKRL